MDKEISEWGSYEKYFAHIILLYDLEVRGASDNIFSLNLVKKGFCQGAIFKEAIERAEERLK